MTVVLKPAQLPRTFQFVFSFGKLLNFGTEILTELMRNRFLFLCVCFDIERIKVLSFRFCVIKTRRLAVKMPFTHTMA